MAKDVEAAKQEAQAAEKKAAELERKLAGQHKNYMKLLSTHNRLVNRCTKEGVDWHREKPAPSSKKRKGGAAR
jgi:hypothetical protein